MCVCIFLFVFMDDDKNASYNICNGLKRLGLVTSSVAASLMDFSIPHPYSPQSKLMIGPRWCVYVSFGNLLIRSTPPYSMKNRMSVSKNNTV